MTRRYKPVGWRGEPHRHYLAAKGIKTNRRYMAYQATYTGADLPLIGADAVGTAGAATVSLIPLAVTAGVLYGGVRGIKRKSEGKSFFARQDGLVTDEDLMEGGSKQLLEEWGFDESRTLVHGTSIENAKKIMQEGKITGGTWVAPTRGGFVDAQVWSQNSFGDDAVVLVAETDTQWPRSWDRGWVTFGDRREEREGTGDELVESARITNIKAFRPVKQEADGSRVDMRKFYE